MRKKLIAFFTGAIIAGVFAGGQASAAAEAYEVQQGDSLWSISQKYGTSVQQLKSWNNLSSDLIFPNQQLHISADTAVNKEQNIDDIYTVKSGDSLWKISQKFGVQVNELKAWNNLSSELIHPGQKLAVQGSAVPVQTEAVNTVSEQPAPAAAPAPQPAPEPEPAQAPAPAEKEVSASPQGKEMTVTATAYTASCNGCSGVTATGIDLRANPGQKVIAVDPSVIPLGSKVFVEGYGTAIAGDTGGAIKGNKIDVFVPSKSEAMNFGVKTVKIKVLH
ncbi:LysM peptidoglycan-binding domain-containing protein [Siminovitchia fortis]|uniref:LysM peptidoglycan-binding domain-containing protein n=1 Tax=Siminovitchia fortis TaxID=254758 RepID=A0A443IR02_9BACI|nr:3D domain-containing protein [Siminovitchia fortis]RWR08597.1 LysM peptidoglycan-binding domain-containing protein [Siminovitchia fortis]WHY83164.1 LysM peptidoglycan-binding domain-containing protein [Siminovitchia fortis]